VPIGEDQLPHLELAREIVRRFNNQFGETLIEPVAKLTSFPRIVGLDGSDKMGKSTGNAIELASTAEETEERIMTAVTDPARRYRNDPGHPKICNIYFLHGYFSEAQLADISRQCRSADIGCVDCKKLLAKHVNASLQGLREKRAELAARPQYIAEVLADGAQRARVIARETLREVKQNMKLI
jgi:tryptophanyl-tRNA synthetase